MASTYSNSGIELIANGEQSGTWGDTTNVNLQIIDRLINGVGSISLSGTTHTLTTSDGSLSDGQYRVLVFGGSPSGTNTVTISPNDATHLYFVRNASGQSVVLTQGSGGNVTIANGDTKVVYSDGAGAGAAVVDITNDFAMGSVNITGGTIDGTVIGGATPAAVTGTTLTATTSATLQHSASTKLATTSTGVDVTGTVTADGLTVNSGSTSSSMIIANSGTSFLSVYSDINGVTLLDVDSNNTGAAPRFQIDVGNVQTFRITEGGDISFYEDTGTTPKFFWDASAEALGIGTSSPDAKLTLKNPSASGDQNILTIQSAASTDALGKVVYNQTDDSLKIINASTYAGSHMDFWTNNTERMRIDSSGNVGIGTSSLAGGNAPLTIGNVGGTGAQINFRNAAANDAYIGLSGDANGDLIHYIGATSDQIFSTAGTERMRITSSGDVGIGTSTPTNYGNLCNLDIGDTVSGLLTLSQSGSARVQLYYDGSAVRFSSFGAGGADIPTAFSANNLERMRIDGSGNLLVGTSSGGSGRIVSVGKADGSIYTFDSNQSPFGTGSIGHIRFVNSNGTVGSITTSGSSTAYNTSSDYRLKEDVQPMTGASDRVLALNPVNFAWKADGSRTDGFLAHEAQAVVPEAVHGTKDEVDADGNPVYQGIDQSKLVPLLTAALQEALGRITALEARVAALEA